MRFFVHISTLRRVSGYCSFKVWNVKESERRVAVMYYWNPIGFVMWGKNYETSVEILISYNGASWIMKVNK
jgi:hypothetical protein